MANTVVFAPAAEDLVAALFRYFAAAASPAIASRFTDGLLDHCESLALFPHRGAPRDDIRPGLRLTHYRGRAAILFAVDADRVEIIGVFHGGQDYEPLLWSDL
jgi:toxin ParE1/3/4